MSYEEIILYITIFSLVGMLVVLGFNFNELLFIHYAIFGKPNIPNTDKKFRYVVLIPARNESHVIRNVLDSLKNQTYDDEYFDVYVIVESSDDPSIKIVKEYGYKIILRTNLENRHRKGYALEEAYEYLTKNNVDFDSLMIFDADNFIDSNFIVELNKLNALGYEIGMGYRKSTNANKSWVSGCSSLLFSLMYGIGSKGRGHHINKVEICGTGYYINKNIIDNEGGWIWHTLTEDAELGKYAMSKNIKCGFTGNAVFFDEQPETIPQMNRQHIRWVIGYASSTGKYKLDKKRRDNTSKWQDFLNRYTYKIGVIPLITVIVTPILYSIAMLIIMIICLSKGNNAYIYALIGMIAGIIFLWLICALSSLFGILFDKKRLEFKTKQYIVVPLTFMFFLVDFITAFFRGLRKKNREWKVIEHTGDVTSKELQKQIANNKKKQKTRKNK